MGKLLIAGAACALILVGPALAQQAQAPAAPAAPATKTEFSDMQLKAYAGVRARLQAMRAPDPAVTAKLLQESGLSIAEYNQIETAAKTDQALNGRIQRFARTGQGAAPEAAAIPASPEKISARR